MSNNNHFKDIENLRNASLSIARYIWPEDSAIFNSEKKKLLKSYIISQNLISHIVFFFLHLKRKKKNQSTGIQ